MASTLQPIILAFKVDGAIPKGSAVKAGATSNSYVQKATAKTDKQIGVAQNATTAVDQKAEIAVAGGAKGLAGGTISMGDMVSATSDGSLIATTTEDDRVIGMAMVDAVTGDLFDMLVIQGGGGI